MANSVDNLVLLIPDDVLYPWPPELDEAERRWMDRQFPLTLNLGDALYNVRYDVGHGVVTLVWTSGNKRFTPQIRYLPPWSGWRIQVQRGNAISVLRD